MQKEKFLVSDLHVVNHLTAAAQRIFSALTAANYQVYLVGGSLRDILLSKEVHDFDFASDAIPSELLTVFQNEKVILTGIAHGTVTVLIEQEAFEITTFRLETTYSDHRHPDGVIFAKRLEDDLARRDFTVNALAYNPQSGLIDLYGGLADLQAGVIRAVGKAEERFHEDALRILRALRFAACLNFTIEAETKAAIYRNFPTLDYVAKERILVEVDKLLQGTSALSILSDFPQLWQLLLPPVLYSGYTELPYTLAGQQTAGQQTAGNSLGAALPTYRETVENAIAKFKCLVGKQQAISTFFKSFQVYQVLAASDYDELFVTYFWAAFIAVFMQLFAAASGTSEARNLTETKLSAVNAAFKQSRALTCKELAAALRFSNLRRSILDAVLYKLPLVKWQSILQLPAAKDRRSAVAQTLVQYGLKDCLFSLGFYSALATELQELQTVLLDFLAKDLPCSLQDLALNGTQLLALRTDIAGKEIKNTLQRLWLAVLTGEVANENAALATFCRTLVL